jgi:hypothetical protein
MLRFVCIKFYHRANNRGKYADGFSHSMIDDKDGHIPSPLIMFTCTALRHALLEWQLDKCVHPKASKSKLKADRPDRSNYFNCKNDGGKIISCCSETGRKLLTSPGVADTYTFLMNTSNTLPESYHPRVYNNTLATAKRQIQQVENPTAAVVISTEAAHVDNAILLDYLTSSDGPRLNSRGLTWEQVMLTGMWVRMATMRMRRKKHRKPMMDQCRMWRSEGIVLESGKIGQYISDM